MVNDNLRQYIRRRRRQLGMGRQIMAGQALVSAVTRCPAYLNSKTMALYLPNDGELDCKPLIRRAWKDRKKCYLPVLKARNTSMSFSLYQPGARLVSNRYRIFEPEPNAAIAPENLDLVILPLVAFDDNGNRIGMGGGYYDRTFSFHQPGVRPYLLGVAHHLQYVNGIQPQVWDVALDGIVSV